jgi:hypothetical protein
MAATIRLFSTRHINLEQKPVTRSNTVYVATQKLFVYLVKHWIIFPKLPCEWGIALHHPSEVSEPKGTWVLQITFDSCVSKFWRVTNKRVKLKLWCSNDVCSNDNAIQAKPEFFHHLERLDCLYDFPFVF